MSPEEFRALGETKHAEYYDGMCVVNPPSRRQVVAVRRLARRLEDACPTGFTVYPDWGWRIGQRTEVLTLPAGPCPTHVVTARPRSPSVGIRSCYAHTDELPCD